jgi:hypothetical protein
MNRTLPALSALAVTFSLLVFAVLQRSAPTPPAGSGVCLDAPPPVAAAPVVTVPAPVNSCGASDALVASAEGAR